MMKHLIKFLIIVIILSLASIKVLKAQDVNYNSIIVPVNAQNLTIEEKLVQIAWKNNPINKISDNNLEIAKRNISLSQVSWLENIRITANVNEFVINPASDIGNRAQFFPLYNFSATVSLGEFISNPQETKLAKIEYDNFKQNINQQKLYVRAETLRRYNDFLYYSKLLNIQVEKTDNAFNNFSLIEEQFLGGESSLELYNSAFSNYKNEQMQLENSKYNLKVSKLTLEEFIGINIEDFLQSNE